MGVGNLVLLMVGNAGIKIMIFYLSRHGHVNITSLVIPIGGEATE